MAASCRRSTTTSGSSTRRDDWTQAHDLAAEQPEKLAELQRLFLIEAAKYNVLPLDDRRIERFNPDLAGPPAARPAATRQMLFGGMGRLTENSVVVMKNKSHAVTAEIVVPDGGAKGVIVAQGGAFGGWSLYAQGRQAGVLLQPLRPAALQGRRRASRSPPASTRSAWSSPTTAAGSARAAPSTLYVDGSKVGEGRVEATVPMLFSGDETLDVGSDSGTPVSDDLEPRTSRVQRARCAGSQIDLGEDAEDTDHLITADERLQIAMARQ